MSAPNILVSLPPWIEERGSVGESREFNGETWHFCAGCANDDSKNKWHVTPSNCRGFRRQQREMRRKSSLLSCTGDANNEKQKGKKRDNKSNSNDSNSNRILLFTPPAATKSKTDNDNGDSDDDEDDEDSFEIQAWVVSRKENKDRTSFGSDYVEVFSPPKFPSPKAPENGAERRGSLEVVGTRGGWDPMATAPHCRFDCTVKLFSQGANDFCNNCYCFICNVPASECHRWKDDHSHCNPTDNYWKEKKTGHIHLS